MIVVAALGSSQVWFINAPRQQRAGNRISSNMRDSSCFRYQIFDLRARHAMKAVHNLRFCVVQVGVALKQRVRGGLFVALPGCRSRGASPGEIATPGRAFGVVMEGQL